MFRNVMVVLGLVLLVAAVVFVGWVLTRPPTDDRGEQVAPVPEADEAVVPGALGAGRPGSLTGEVRVLATLEPATGIEVEVAGSGDPFYVRTDRAGRFLASAPAGVGLTIRVIAPEPYATLEIRGITLDPGKSTSLGTLYLEKAFLVRGIVVDPQGRGAGGALVSAHRPLADAANPNILDAITAMGRKRVPLDETVAGDDGTFTFSGLSPGTYQLEAEAEGFAPGFLSGASVSPETSAHVFRIVVAEGVALSGTVKTAAADPVAGALVTTLRTGGRNLSGFDFRPVQVATDEDGKFRFACLSPGEGGLMVAAEGYPMTIVERVQVGSQESVDVVLGGTATVTGKVSESGGEPIEGAEILIAVGRSGGNFGRAVTDAEGRYRVEHLVAGNIQFFMVKKDGYPGYPSMNDMMGPGRGGGFGKLEDGATLTKDVTLVKGAVVTGVVTDSTSGRAVPGAEVSLRSFGAMFGIGGAASAITGENGAYRLEGAGEGTHLLAVKAAGFVQEGLDGAGFQRMFRPGRESGDSPQSGPIIQIGPDVAEVRRDLSVVPGASIRGVVVDTNDRPVSGATVSVTGGRDARDGFGMMPGGGSGAGSAMTNPEGEFRVDGAAAGDKLKLRAAAEGYVEGFSENISVTVGAEVTGVVIRLGKGGTLTGTVVGSDGKPLGGATVRAIPWNSQPGMGPQVPTWQLRQTEGVATDEAGSFTVEGLKPGPILVGVEAPDHRQLIVKDLSVVEGQVTGGGVLALERGLAITGRLTNEAGEGVATASIWLQREQVEGVPPDFSGTGRAVVAKDGSFRVDGLAPGRYALNATGSGYAPEAVTGVAAGSSGVDILLRKGLAISGRVLLPDGSPASGSRVRVWSDADQRSASARTAEDGSFTVENLKPGTYSVSASAPRGSGPGPDRPSPLNVREATVPGVAAGTRSLEIRLVPGVSITGIVVTEAGVAVAGARVFARSAGSGASGSGMSGPDGSFEVTGLAEGEYDMNAWMQGYGPADAVKSPAPGTGVRLVLKPAPVPQEK